jgi:hypothetical protein
VAEYGSSFRTASWLDVAALYHAEFYSFQRFTISNPNVPGAVFVDTSSGGYAIMNNPGTVQTVPVACVRSTAPLQFTRATVISTSTVAAKDALCDAEFGPAYNTASWLDIAALYRSVFYSFQRFTIANTNVTGAVFVDTSSGGYAIMNNPGTVQTVPVACALR